MTQCQLLASSVSLSLAAVQRCSITKTSNRTLRAARKSSASAVLIFIR